MSKTTPVRWWRDDATRYCSAYSRTLTAHAMDLIWSDHLLDVRIRAAGGWRGFIVVEPRDSLLESQPPPDPWEQFALRCAEGTS